MRYFNLAMENSDYNLLLKAKNKCKQTWYEWLMSHAKKDLDMDMTDAIIELDDQTENDN